jgi:hypothetical protein
LGDKEGKVKVASWECNGDVTYPSTGNEGTTK